MVPHAANVCFLSRRSFLQLGTAGLAALPLGRALGQEKSAEKDKPTQFQIACMTIPYAQFPVERALNGLKSAGYQYVAWGSSRREADGKRGPFLAPEAPPNQAKELGQRCRDLGLEPLMMFSGIYPEAKDHLEVLKNRIRQASAAGIPQVLTFGNTKGGDRKLWIEHFKTLGPIARDHGVLIVIKPHGGLTARGSLCAAIVRDVADEGVKANYDAGNVMDYLKLDAATVLADLRACAAEVRSFCIKDHRMFPRDEDCGPGLGEIDHYRLLAPVAFTGRAMPLCCENISAPGLPAPANPDGVDALARRAREFLELVIRGLQVARVR
jgi:sugar phosphate isomerase/epimerase